MIIFVGKLNNLFKILEFSTFKNSIFSFIKFSIFKLKLFIKYKSVKKYIDNLISDKKNNIFIIIFIEKLNISLEAKEIT